MADEDARPDDELSEDELAARRQAKEEGNGAASIADRAAEGEGQDEEEPDPSAIPLPALASDRQLSLNVGGPRKRPIESHISIMSKSHPIEAMLDPDVEQQLVVTVRAQDYKYVPVRENDETIRWKLVQQLRIVAVARVGTEAGDAALGGTG